MRPAADIGMVATASYIPQTRVALARLAEHASACATSPREALMQSVYEDTIRWRQMEPACTAPLAAENTVVKLPYDSGMRAVAVESTMLLSDMALHVARPLVTRKGDDHARGTTDLFVVCHSSLEHDLTLSSACRLQCELKQGRAPFAVGQLQGASFLMALQTVAALMATEEELERALIVASERWRGPFSRVTGSLTALGDGAGAALVQRGATSGWTLRSINVRTPAVASQTDARLCTR